MTFSGNVLGVNEQAGREKLAAAVKRDRKARYRTVDEARQAARISRGAWDSVEKAQPVKGFTLTAVEKALGWPPGRAEDLLAGRSIATPRELEQMLAELDQAEISPSTRDYIRPQLEADLAAIRAATGEVGT